MVDELFSENSKKSYKPIFPKISLQLSQALGLLLIIFVFFFKLINIVASCDVIGATYCIHKPDKDLKEEKFEEYCDKYKEHLECVYSKYKGCDKKEKYIEAMESMIKGLRKKAKQVTILIII